MIVADQVDGPHCRVSALNHLAIDEIYGDPNSKIFFELLRLTDTAPVEPSPSRLNLGFRQQKRTR